VLYFTGDIVEENFVRDEDDTTDEYSDDEKKDDDYEKFDFSDVISDESSTQSM